jgi:hypothetical protein
LCGAIFADEEFEKLVSGKLGKKWGQMSNESRKRIMHRDWELGIKRDFSTEGKAAQTYNVEVPSDGLKVGILGRQKVNSKSTGIVNGMLQLNR